MAQLTPIYSSKSNSKIFVAMDFFRVTRGKTCTAVIEY
jgi:hypothetical protein